MIRKKTKKVIITFHTIAQAMAAEKFCRLAGLSGRLIPVPRQLSAGCGLAWAAPPDEGEKTRDVMEQAGIQWEAWTELEL